MRAVSWGGSTPQLVHRAVGRPPPYESEVSIFCAEDLRPLLVEDAPGFGDLQEDTDDMWVAWRLTRSNERAWWRELLIAAASFARDHGLVSHYRRRFAGVAAREISDSAGKVHHRSAVAPIWEIANELVVGVYLERVLGWTLELHEPEGFRGRRGEWQFATPRGRPVFVEVKSLIESEIVVTHVFSRGVATRRLTSVLRGAYRQLPDDGRSTLVVVVGNGLILEISRGIMHGDLFQTLFGRVVVTFQVLPYVEGSERMGPTFREMFTHAGKHRRLGCVAGLTIGGLDFPSLGFYAIHNPFADPEVRLHSSDFEDTRQFWVDEDGFGQESQGIHPRVAWGRICERDDA